ncbi:MAG: glycosyltransferase, partial [Flavobacteriales bacterium]
MDISIVVPLYNEVDSLYELHEWIVRVMNAYKFSYEVIFVDDGSKDGSWDVVQQLNEKD